MDVVTVTLNPALDKTFAVSQLLANRKLRARNVALFPGGGGLNVARAVHELGGDVRALWSCGGSSGERLARLLDREEIPHQPVPVEEPVRENLIVTEESSGEQYRFGMPGPELGERERERWLESLRDLGSVPYVVLSGSLPAGASEAWYGEILRELSGRVRIVVDTKGPALARALREGVFLAKPNLQELEDLVGRKLPGDEEIEEAARELVESGGAEVVLLSLGRGGARLVSRSESECLASPTVPVRSRIGAGDSMVGGVVLALAKGRSLGDAAALGVAAGAAAVMREGTALCRREDTERLYERLQRRRAART